MLQLNPLVYFVGLKILKAFFLYWWIEFNILYVDEGNVGTVNLIHEKEWSACGTSDDEDSLQLSKQP